MDAPLKSSVLGVGNQARQQLEQYGPLTVQNALWAGTPNYDALIDAAAIATEAYFVAAGLTAQQLGDAIYALEQIRTVITNALPALSILAQI